MTARPDRHCRRSLISIWTRSPRSSRHAAMAVISGGASWAARRLAPLRHRFCRAFDAQRRAALVMRDH